MRFFTAEDESITRHARSSPDPEAAKPRKEGVSGVVSVSLSFQPGIEPGTRRRAFRSTAGSPRRIAARADSRPRTSEQSKTGTQTHSDRSFSVT